MSGKMRPGKQPTSIHDDATDNLPVVETREGFAVFMNDVARQLFPDLMAQGATHPFLQGLDRLPRRAENGIRDVQVGGRHWRQTWRRVGNGDGLLLRGIEVTDLQLLGGALFEHVTNLQKTCAAMDQARSLAETELLAQREFIANLSHEIRTPLTAILGYTDVLIDESWGRRSTLDGLSIIKRNGEHLVNVINNVLDLSKLEAGKVAVERCEFAPAQVIEEVCQTLRFKADGKDLRLATVFEGPIPSGIVSDPTRFKQILLNLLGNAIKFTQSGNVTVRARYQTQTSEAPHRLVVGVMDTGPGMSREQLARLFQPFVQADDTIGRKFGGTGLGLVISQRLTQLLGGELTVESELGRGSTFTFAFEAPLSENAALVEISTTAAAGRPIATARPVADTPLEAHILLAEDGIDNQRLISLILRKAGARVAVVDNGAAALKMLRTAFEAANPFDLAVLDVQMPIMDGYTAARTMREQGYNLPILALTAHVMAGERERCIAAGYSEYFTKPIDRARFIQLVRKLLQGANVNSAGAPLAPPVVDVSLVAESSAMN